MVQDYVPLAMMSLQVLQGDVGYQSWLEKSSTFFLGFQASFVALFFLVFPTKISVVVTRTGAQREVMDFQLECKTMLRAVGQAR